MTFLFQKMTDWEVTEIQGPEAQDFLQRLTSANFRTLQVGSFTPCTLLQANGKVILYFKVLHVKPGYYLFLTPAHPDTPNAAQATFDALEKMHFREDFTITPRQGEWSYVRVIGSDASALQRALGQNPPELKNFTQIDGAFVLNEGQWSAEPIKVDLGLLVPQPKLGEWIARLEKAGFRESPSLEGYRIRAAASAVPNEISSNVIALEAKLDDAVHENKGCYPGQEVIERIRTMGQVPRLLIKFRGTGVIPTPTTTIQAETPEASSVDAGTITSAATDPLEPQSWVGLGYVRRVFAKPETVFKVAGATVQVEYK